MTTRIFDADCALYAISVPLFCNHDVCFETPDPHICSRWGIWGYLYLDSALSGARMDHRRDPESRPVPLRLVWSQSTEIHSSATPNPLSTGWAPLRRTTESCDRRIRECLPPSSVPHRAPEEYDNLVPDVDDAGRLHRLHGGIHWTQPSTAWFTVVPAGPHADERRQ